jgi:glycosyltransferase involved in cell wall biosynthesis
MKFSVIITCFNYENYLRESILSVLNQVNFSDYELIVIDDGSSDNSPNIARSFGHKINFIQTDNLGVEAASNMGIKHSQGEYIVRLDADDLFSPHYLYKMKELIQNNLNLKCSFFYSEYIVINNLGKKIFSKSLPPFNTNEIKSRGDFLATGTIYSRHSLEEIGLYDISIKNSGLENYELILKLITNGHIGYCCHEELFYYRHHSQSLSKFKHDKIINNGNNLFAKLNLGQYQTNTNHPYGLVIAV